MDTKPKSWGNPGPKSTPNQWINYSNQIRLLDDKSVQEIDLIMIDGRFRVACCLRCFDIITDKCVIIFDDFF